MAQIDGTGNVVDISTTDTTRFNPRTHADACDVHDRLEELSKSLVCPRTGIIKKTPIDKKQQSAGMSFNPSGLLANRRLRAVLNYELTRLDAMHTLVCKGCVAKDLWQFLTEAEQQKG